MHILDEGLFHKLKQLRCKPKSPVSAAKRFPLSEIWHSGLPVCDALIIIEPDVETVQANRIRRGRPAKENIDAASLADTIAAYRRDAEYLREQFENFNYIVIPNQRGTDIEEQVNRIVEFISKNSNGLSR